MIRHIVLMLSLIAIAIGSGFALVPGDRERSTMLVRDGHNEEALQILEARYAAGGRDLADVLQLYKLLMADAQIARATQLVEQLATARPTDVETLTLLAKHYSDTQDHNGQTRTLERLFALDPSAKAAENLLSIYRLDGAYGQEEKLLHALLDRHMIVASDAERLGLLALAHDDVDEALTALARFDALAAPEQMAGRFALFDVLVRKGDKPTAFGKASAWIHNLQKANVQLALDPDGPAVRLGEWMSAADAIAPVKPVAVASKADTRRPTKDVALQKRAQRVRPLHVAFPVAALAPRDSRRSAKPFQRTVNKQLKNEIVAQNAARRLHPVPAKKSIALVKPSERQIPRKILQQRTRNKASG